MRALHVEEAGSGDPVVLVHGWPQHSGTWRHVVPLLRDHCHVLAPDLPGFGRSPDPGSGFGSDRFAGDVLALLDDRGIERATLVGHDWGGNTVLRVAEQAPERCVRVLAIGTPHLWLRPSPALAMGAWRSWYAALLALPGAARLAPHLLARGPQGIDATWAAQLRGRHGATTRLYRAYWRQLGMGARRDGDWPPIHLMVGAQEQAFPLAAVTGGDPPPQVTRQVVPGIGHWIPEERPELVAGWVLAQPSDTPSATIASDTTKIAPS